MPIPPFVRSGYRACAARSWGRDDNTSKPCTYDTLATARPGQPRGGVRCKDRRGLVTRVDDADGVANLLQEPFGAGFHGFFQWFDGRWGRTYTGWHDGQAGDPQARRIPPSTSTMFSHKIPSEGIMRRSLPIIPHRGTKSGVAGWRFMWNQLPGIIVRHEVWACAIPQT